MSEHDYVIDNASGAAVRSDLNNALAAIVTQNSKSAEPTTKFAYMLWADTTNNRLKQRNAANTDWIDRGSLAHGGFGILQKGADIVSGATLSPGSDGNYFDVTGTTTITAIATQGLGTVIKLHFDAALTLTHHATDLVLPGGANITTAAGDEAEFLEYASGDWRCLNYQRAAQGPGTHLVQMLEDEQSAFGSGTPSATILADNSIPQIGEGTQVLSQVITPTNNNNTLVINVHLTVSASIATTVSAWLFDGSANALAGNFVGISVANEGGNISFRHVIRGGIGTAAKTYTVRFGPIATATTYLNGWGSATKFGSVHSSILSIEEYAA